MRRPERHTVLVDQWLGHHGRGPWSSPTLVVDPHRVRGRLPEELTGDVVASRHGLPARDEEGVASRVHREPGRRAQHAVAGDQLEADRLEGDGVYVVHGPMIVTDLACSATVNPAGG